MDSPEPSKTTTAAISTAAASSSLSESTAVQESPVFNYINNLSPIGPVKTTTVVQDFPGINSPPLVFTSPRINPRIQPSFLERTRFPQLSNEEFSIKDGNQNNISTLTDEAGSTNSQLSSGLVPCTDKVCDNNCSVQEQTESQPICVDDFLVDAVKLGSLDSKNYSPQQDVRETQTENGMTMDAPSDILEQVEEDHKGKTSVDTEPFETNQKKRDDGVESDPSSKTQPDSSVDVALDNQYAHRIMIEAGEHQRGIFRRCLQFEDVLQKTAILPDPCNLSESVNCSNSAASPIAPEALQSFSLNTSTTQSCRQLCDSRNTENSSLKTPKPSGIGLHLNSIVNTVQGGCSATLSMKSAERGNISVQGKTLISRIKYRVMDNSKKCLISSNVGEDILARVEDSTLQGESSAQLPLHSVNPMDSITSLNPLECQSTPGHKRKSSSENFDEAVTYNQSSPKKKRKKTSDASDGDGCKRCNCKKSKCLKLYCDCFAAGIYCADLCACQGCFNKPDYEDTVLETRQQIESRNPLAFAPKVVQNMADSHSNILRDNGVSFTPSSARHKRGCNCKKSMCLKKYCECYQANVGCSSGCRCEGCKNVYGQKEEYGSIKDLVKKLGTSGRIQGSFDEKLELLSSIDTFEHAELSQPHNMTPVTPFQSSDHRNDESKSWFPSGGCSQSPESDHISCFEMSKGFSKDPELINETIDVLDLVSFDEEVENGNATAATEFPVGDTSQLVLPNSQQLVNPRTHHLWRCSPITPVTLHGSKGPVDLVNSDSSTFNVVEDDTPEILRDTSTPSIGVKVTSPNKKRVSPPHHHPSDCSSSARRLKAGRKYKLGSVPSFPPLTPCFDSKASIVGQNTNDHQKPSSSK